MSPAMTSVGVTVTFDGDDTAVLCAPGETILLAGLRSGVAVPYECASGGCGSCRARLMTGSVNSRWADATGLTERDRRRGDRILMCQSVPDGPCVVSVPPVTVVAAEPEPHPRRLPGRVAQRELLNADTVRMVVEASEGVPYLSGQFVIIEFSDGVRRAYSMSRPARCADPRQLELLVRAKPGGAATSWLFGPQADGLPVIVEGPYGRAYARRSCTRPVLCLAGGTGLAPMLAIAGELTGDGGGPVVGVYVGARHPGDLVMPGRIAALRDRGVQVIPVVEQHTGRGDPELGELRSGLALDHLATDQPDLSQYDIYVAGPPAMIDAALRRLVRKGTASADRIFFDRFIG
jgi:NAD(P)H-flavin reductase/ferredoxin